MKSRVIIKIVFILVVINKLAAQNFTITNTSNHYQNHFGWDIAGSGEYCFISDPRDSIFDLGNGSVSIYKNNNEKWSFITKIASSNPIAYGLFGYRIAVNNNFLIISEIGNNLNGFMSGRIIIYELTENKWTYKQEIFPPKTSKLSKFGESIFLIDNFLFVGAPDYESGAVFVYKVTNGFFKFLQEIIPPFEVDFEFGKSICANEKFLFIGAPSFKSPLIQGGVFVYKKNNDIWQEETYFKDDTNKQGSLFGISLAVNKNKLVIGAPHSTIISNNEEMYYAGQVYTASYINNSWSLDKYSIKSKTPSGHDLFGSKVEINDSLIFISSPRNNNINTDGGIISMFKLKNEEWIQDTVYLPVSKTIYFGNNMKLSKEHLFVSLGGEKQKKYKGHIFIYGIKDLITSNYKSLSEYKTDIQIYPNPINELINIKSDLSQNIRIKLYSMNGALLKSKNFNKSTSINTFDLPEGIYTIAIELKTGIIMKKIVISH